MKIKLEITIEFENWMDKNQAPKSPEEWEDFFLSFMVPDSGIVGDGDKDLVNIESYMIKCLNIEH